MSYTKGKWEIANHGNKVIEIQVEVYPQRWQQIAQIVDFGDGGDDPIPTLANARLIAAAPDMYEACKLSLDITHNRGHATPNGSGRAFTAEELNIIGNALRNAISKAEGK